MGLDIYFRKQRHQGMYDAIAELNEQRTKFVNAEYELSATQHEIIEKAYALTNSLKASGVKTECVKIDTILYNFCKPVYKEVVKNVKGIIAKYNDDELTSEVVVTVPKKTGYAGDYFNMGKFESKNVAYFRKVNFLLPFFGYEENCSDIEIDKYQVEDLVNACQTILDTLKTSGTQVATEVANEMLPTEGGFFFGSTEYDEWYFKDVEYVRNEFTRILETFDWENETLIMHCWW